MLRHLLSLAAFLLSYAAFPVNAQNDDAEMHPSEEVMPYYTELLRILNSGDDGREYVLSLPVELQWTLQAYMRPTQGETIRYVYADTTIAQSFSAVSSGCLITEVHVPYYDIVGTPTYTYKQKFDWCWNGTNITSLNRTRWGEVHVPHYFYFDGHIGNSESGGSGQASYFAMTQGKFRYQFWSIVEERYPRIEQWAYGNGTHSGNGWW
jgi:hypothetical protein